VVLRRWARVVRLYLEPFRHTTGRGSATVVVVHLGLCLGLLDRSDLRQGARFLVVVSLGQGL
jgi:hypothetical protein